MTDDIAEIKRTAGIISSLTPHRFEIITALGDGAPIPPEALSEDHTVGIYGAIFPLKMRESIDGYREVEVADFVPQLTHERTSTNSLSDNVVFCIAT